MHIDFFFKKLLMKTKFIFLLVTIFLYVGSTNAQTEKPVKQTEKLFVGGKVSTMNVKSVDSKLLMREKSTDINMLTIEQNDKEVNVENQTNSNVIRDEKKGKKINLKKIAACYKTDKK